MGALLMLPVLSTAGTAASSDSDFFDLVSPGHMSLTLFASGYASHAYQKTDEGFELEQSVTRYVGLIGRFSAYQVYYGDGFDTPFIASPGAGVRNYGVLSGGINLIPSLGTSLVVFGGESLGSSWGPVVDGRCSTWILFHSLHPISLSFDGAHYYHNGLSGGRMDLQAVTFSTEQLALLVGVGGAIWGGGPETSNLHGQAGPDIGMFIRRLHLRVDLQVGYGGDQHTDGLLSMTRNFGWDE